MSDRLRTIGILGGTFDPIHIGHLRAAIEVTENLALDEMRLLPCQYPPHRSTPTVTPEHRLNMVRLAIQGTSLQVDDREMHRDGPSYSIDTLMSFKRDYPKASLCMVVGVDAFLGLTTWFQWETLIQLANIVVIHRSGWELPKTGMIAELLEERALVGKSVHEVASGHIITQNISGLEVSSTQIRNLISQHKSPLFLLPEKVHSYIQQQRLYGYDQNSSIQQPERSQI